MLPTALVGTSFAAYPAEAKDLVTSHLGLLRQMPLAFLPSLLQEIIEYDYKFPVERSELDGQLAAMSVLPPDRIKTLFADFWEIRMSPDQEKVDWVNEPQRFTEQFSAYLWSTHQMDAFRQAATSFATTVQPRPAPEPEVQQRLGIAVIGQGVGGSAPLPLFAKLRPLGTYFTNVEPAGGLQQLLAAAAARAVAYPAAYAHWYVDGGQAAPCSPLLCQVSYTALAPVRNLLLQKIQRQVSLPGMGPERLRDYLARMTPDDLGLHRDPLLDRFNIKILAEGSGTQIYSTTFAQWTAREVLRRSAASTLLVRFAPRQRQRSMSELLANPAQGTELDPAGSLVDADMAAYYHWINQQRLPGSQHSGFLAWFEDQKQAIVIGPSVSRGVTSASPLTLGELVALATA